MYEIEFYEKPNGKIPVAEFINNLNYKMKAKAFFESGNYNPTIDFLNRVCTALGRKLTINIK